MIRVRAWLWYSGAPARALLLGSIRGYRAVLSGWLGGQCRFYPSCSHYAEDAIRIYGAGRGSILASWRLLRCNPFGEGGVDPVATSPSRRRGEPGSRAGLAHNDHNDLARDNLGHGRRAGVVYDSLILHEMRNADGAEHR